MADLATPCVLGSVVAGAGTDIRLRTARWSRDVVDLDGGGVGDVWGRLDTVADERLTLLRRGNLIFSVGVAIEGTAGPPDEDGTGFSIAVNEVDTQAGAGVDAVCVDPDGTTIDIVEARLDFRATDSLPPREFLGDVLRRLCCFARLVFLGCVGGAAGASTFIWVGKLVEALSMTSSADSAISKLGITCVKFHQKANSRTIQGQRT